MPLGQHRRRHHDYAYDEYGIPRSTDTGRFQYTGQTSLPELGMYYYKARIYSPTLGRFLQPDPIGYGGGMNLYAYVGGDPVNFVDPEGLAPAPPPVPPTGTRIPGGSANLSGGVGTLPGVPSERSGNGGFARLCVANCGAAGVEYDAQGNETIIITAPTYEWVSNGVQFYVQNGRYVLNPNFRQPWWAKWFDRGVSAFVAGPAFIALGGEVAALPALIPVGTSTVTNTRMGALVGWGRGGPAAAARTAEISRAEVAAMRANGLTKGDVVYWRDFYMRTMMRGGRGIGVANYRYSLMETILQNW